MGMDKCRAEAALSAVQGKWGPVRATILGVPVAVTALPGNAFRISGVPCSGDGKPFRVLADAGLDVGPGKKPDTYDAVATWDTMLHRLVMEGTIVLSGKLAHDGTDGKGDDGHVDG